ncbi:hypothetical protein [Spirillospora sp. NPDC048819]|uniref:hypothetical protein n=1 Tax=Spirillospora sp. NPDC048819 TaxID=3155268 RepID=UPI0033C4CAF1
MTGAIDVTSVDLYAVGPALTREQLALRAAAVIADRFPGVKAWYGTKTRRCWAYVPTFPALLEAATFGQLAVEIAQIRWERY